MVHYAFLAEPSPDQIAWITALYRDAGWWSAADSDSDLTVRIIAGSHCFLVAVVSGRIVGMGRAISDRASDAYIQDVTVDAAYRGQGIGTQIVQRLVRRIRQDGLGWIGLIAEKNSRQFYEPMGFKQMPDATPMLWTS